MSDSARLYAYKALFEAKRLVTRADMMEVAEVSLATFKCDIAKLRDQMGMHILFDKDRMAQIEVRSSKNQKCLPADLA